MVRHGEVFIASRRLLKISLLEHLDSFYIIISTNNSSKLIIWDLYVSQTIRLPFIKPRCSMRYGSSAFIRYFFLSRVVY